MSLTPDDRDRRLEPRLADDNVVHVEYLAPSPHVRDLSASGVYLADPRQLQLGQTVKLRLSLGAAGVPFVVTGMVRRVDPGQGFAVEFIQLEAADRRRLKEFIARSNPEKVSPAGDDGLR